MLENIKKTDKKMLFTMGIVVGIIVLFIVAVVIFFLFSGRKLSYSKIESKMISAAKDYCKDDNSRLPAEVGEIKEIDVSYLVSGEYIKDLSEYTDDGVVCSGKVVVAKTDTGYDYVPSLDCGDAYKTVFLYDKLKENVVTSGNGLYAMGDVVRTGDSLGFDDNGYDLSSNELMSGFVYRGSNVNNYIKIDNNLYRIVKIDGKNDFTIVEVKPRKHGVFDGSYNSEVSRDYGINNYEMSTAYTKLLEVYNNLDKKSVIKQKGVGKNICIGGRVNEEATTDGSAECSKVMNNQFFSLLPLFDYMNASLSDECDQSDSRSCSNYNYLSGNSGYWFLTPSADNTYDMYRYSSGEVDSKQASISSNYRIVYYLSSRLIYVSGSGTENDPYIVK